MKSADDWSKEGKYSHCSFYDSRPACDCECGNETVCPKLATFIRAIQTDALKAAAGKCARLSNGEHRMHPAVEWSAMAKQTREIAHWAFQDASVEILSLIPKEGE